jgi:hypothetical protein
MSPAKSKSAKAAATLVTHEKPRLDIVRKR